MIHMRYISSMLLLVGGLASVGWAQKKQDTAAVISVTASSDWVMPKTIDIPQVLKPLVDQTVNHNGVPVVKMWQNPMPTDAPDAGYPAMPSAKHVFIFKASVETGGYNHHTNFMMHQGKFYATWSNHPKGEDSPGQRVLFSISEDGENWSPFAESYPRPRPVGEFEESGYYCVASPWFVHNDKVYATGQLFETMGWENVDKTELQPIRDRQHKFRRFRFVTRMIRPVYEDGTLGPMVALHPETLPEPGKISLPLVDISTVTAEHAQALEALKASRKELTNKYSNFPPPGVDPSRLCEPTIYTAPDGKTITLLRDDKYSHRLYVSVLDESTMRWCDALPTNIPDSPSMTTAVSLSDGRVILVGNQMATAFDNVKQRKHYGRDPLVLSVSYDGYRFTSAYALRCGKQQYRVPNVKGRGGGPQYPNLAVYGDKLYVMYSIGKEDIAISIVPLKDLK